MWPFAGAKELVAGDWLIQARSLDQAIGWVKRYPYPLGPDGEGEVEIREELEGPSPSGSLPAARRAGAQKKCLALSIPPAVVRRPSEARNEQLSVE
ncbi:uncharacterized protein SOCE26_001220 [Sorangium cellulosum]|uniref:Uncharacterized protein n=1 Tax=Sorangium cellulosum TaxID=56 RepID=A0A2L0EHH1_SORCE|nr:YciI family protein [Sorangium cellulosum]AUX38744.1 uncharacterized protein SOCE26_001220 [Sorangium cellulosum]